MTFSNIEFDEQGMASASISGKAGNIEILVTQPQTITATSPIAVICHPHPLYGGSMNNKVVYILAKTFNELDAITVRFNFRGVGKSTGEFAHGIGEAEDLQLLVSELQKWRPDAPLWLAGFSFGAYVVARAQAVLEPQKLLLVAPPVSMYAFSALPGIHCPWVVIQGGQDEVIDAEAVKTWVAEQVHQPQLIWMEDASHFFHGKLNEIKAVLLSAWFPL